MRLRIVPVLIIKNSQNKTVARLPLYDGQFIHHYIHSIHKTAVDEYFQIKGRNLELFQVKYDTYGVGMPSDGGEAFTIEDGRFVVKMHRTFSNIPIRVSIIPQHGVIVGNELLSLHNGCCQNQKLPSPRENADILQWEEFSKMSDLPIHEQETTGDARDFEEIR